MKPSSFYLFSSGATFALAIGSLCVQDIPPGSAASLFILCILTSVWTGVAGVVALDKEGQS